MLHNTRFRYATLAAGAYLLLCLISLHQIHSSPVDQVKTSGKISAVGQRKSGDTKRIAPVSAKSPLAIKRRVSSKRAETDSNKFQARMMNTAIDQQPQQPRAQQQQQQYFNSESWQNQHSLLPTFTDQEQGDEMVALASDSDPQLQEQVVKVPSTRVKPADASVTSSSSSSSSSASSSSSPTSSQQQQQTQQSQKYGQRELDNSRVQQQQADPRQLPAIKDNQQQQQQQQVNKQQLHSEEYYGDEEEEDEDLIGGKGAGDLPELLSNQHQERFKFKPLNNYEEFPAQNSFEQSANDYRRQIEAAQVNRSASRVKLEPSSDSAWLPTSGLSNNGEQLEKSTASAAVEQQPAGKRQQPEKIGELFGTGGTFTRADVAIEYLKNILKTKQNLMNSTSSSQSSISKQHQQQQAAVDLPLEKSARNRLNSFAPRPFSASVPFFNQTLNSVNNSTGEQMSSYEKQQQQQQVDQQLSIKSFLPQQQQSDSKFSISDAKPTTSQDFNSLPAFQTSTTRLPGNDDRYDMKFSRSPINSEQQLYQKSLLHPAATSFVHSQQQQLQHSELSPGSSPNGTPLGGDYIESLDDFPRAALRQQQQQQQQQQQIFGLESQPQVTIKEAQDNRSQEEIAQVNQREGPTGEQVVREAAKQRQAAAQHARQVKYDLQEQQQVQQIQQQQQQQQRLHYQQQLKQQHQLSRRPSSSRYFQMNTGTVPEQQQQISPFSSFASAPVAIDTPPTTKLANGIVDLHSNQQQQQQVLQSTASQSQVVRDNQQVKAEAKPERNEESAAVKSAAPINLQPPSQQPKPTAIANQQVPTLNQNAQKVQQNQPQQPHSSSSQYHHSKSANSQPQISSKIYREEYQSAGAAAAIPHPAAPAAHLPPPALVDQPAPIKQQVESAFASQLGQQSGSSKAKPPKIVSYNYFESPTEQGESELLATNYQLGDALYSSTGGVEQVLSNSELEAIQSQFMTAQHPVIPLGNDPSAVYEQHQQPPQNFVQPDSHLAGILANLKPTNNGPEELQRLHSPAKQAEDVMKELASNEGLSIAVAPQQEAQPQNPFNRNTGQLEDDLEDKKAFPKQQQSQQDALKKKKSLIVYLNHPRPTDMSKAPTDGYSLAQAIGEAPSDSFVSAKEFDSHGLSKDSKHLDVSSLRGLGDIKEGQDGLSVVVIGDAYKYKKIVLLISSKSGGLKFIPMVKDMKR